MTMRPKGKHVKQIDVWSPNALAICDYTQFIFERRHLIKQYEWRGNRLVWTGFLVGKPYADIPNEQLRPPLIKPDPIPVRNPRLPQGTQIEWQVLNTEAWNTINYINWAAWGNYQDGFPALAPALRLANLQAGGYWEPPNLNIGYYQPTPTIIPEDVRLSNLQNFRWVST